MALTEEAHAGSLSHGGDVAILYLRVSCMPIFSSVLVVFFYVAICILGYLVCQIVSFVLVVFFYVAICILGYLVCPFLVLFLWFSFF